MTVLLEAKDLMERKADQLEYRLRLLTVSMAEHVEVKVVQADIPVGEGRDDLDRDAAIVCFDELEARDVALHLNPALFVLRHEVVLH